MTDFVMDDAEQARTEEKARADALAGKHELPFPIVNGSALDKVRKAAYNSAYEAAHTPTPSSLAEQYEAKFGKKPHWKMKPESIQAALDEAT